MSRRFRFLPFTLALAATLLAACGGAAPSAPFEQPSPPAPGPGGGGGETPPPTPPRDPVWSGNAYGFGRTALYGSFTSDLVRHGDTLFVPDADQIEADGAKILAIDIAGPAPVASTRFAPTTIRAGDLRDSFGAVPSLASPIGFGYYVNDLCIASDTLAFALANAGGSDSTPTLSNLVAFDPSTGTVLQVVNLASGFVSAQPLFDSSGAQLIGGFVQSGAEAVAYVPLSSTTGRLYVAMTNLVVGAPSYGATKLPGTVQAFDVRPADAQPVSAIFDPGLATRTFVTKTYNPVALQAIQPDAGLGWRLLVTTAGTTGYDAQFNLVPTTAASVEAYDATTGVYQGRFDLGLAGLAAARPALGTDAAGHRVGFYGSAVNGELYLLRLDGLYAATIDPSRLAVLRGPQNGIPITSAQAGGPGGNLSGVALSPDGRTLAVTGFGDLFAFPSPLPGKLFLLNLPDDVVSGSGFGTNFVPGATEFASVPGRTTAQVVLAPGGSGPEVYVGVGGTVDGNFLGSGSASLGTLDTFGLVR